ncbi:MAG: Gfo/Idh/MocA family oxidoreductase [Verrucomicrobiaceae bacterium]|nr:Gfo/Idh/MocA family oxidoreductase [Verrucomicrobiaceae bacterium]
MNPNANTTNRRQFLGTTIGAAGLAAMPSWTRAQGANSDIRVAVVGVNGRGNGHISQLKKIKGVRIVALCDVDQVVLDKRIAENTKDGSYIKSYRDYRDLVKDPEVDAITIATPNHSHVLIAMTGIAAGKHVYVEKPVCHNPIEGRKLVEAAAKRPNLIVQHGMQRRSDLGWAEVMEFIKSGQFGKVTLSRALNYKMRKPIGKVASPVAAKDGVVAGDFRDTGGKPQKVNVDYNLWSAPRPATAFNREQFHYDWHWQWAYGNGDIGNQGPHQLDVARWALGNPEHLPKRVMSFGNRYGLSDDGQTPNNQLAFYEFEGAAPMLMDNRGLPAKDMDWKGRMPYYQGIQIGNVIHCEGGIIAETKATDKDGKLAKKFEILDGPDHMKNFINSIRAGKLVNENCHISHGYHAACLAHMANYSWRVGQTKSADEIREMLKADAMATETYQNFMENLTANKIDLAKDQTIVGPWLNFDPVAERFVGDFAAEANKLMEEEYAAGFELPVIS